MKDATPSSETTDGRGVRYRTHDEVSASAFSLGAWRAPETKVSDYAKMSDSATEPGEQEDEDLMSVI